jgi:hypothetical protein
MPENRLQFIIEVNAAAGTAGIKAVGDSLAQLQARTRALSGEYATLSGNARQTAAAKQKLSETTREASRNIDRTTSSAMSLSSAIKAVATSWAAWKAVEATRATLNYLAEIETATLGIGAAFMTGGKYIDATTGKALEAQAALRASQEDARRLIGELQYANLQTIATLDQLIVAYQQALPVALAKGFNREQVKEFTVAMVQAAGAIGLPMEQLAEEMRSLLIGQINPRNTRIATVLGLRNEDIAQFKSDATGLFDFLMEKLEAYKVAGLAAQTTWAGLWSNTKDIALKVLGEGMQPLFDAIKQELQNIAGEMVTLDEKTKTIKWNPELLRGIESFKGGVEAAVAEFYRLGMLLDKFGGSYAGLRFLMSPTEAGQAYWAKQNDLYRQRYMESEKNLQDMAMRSAGWSPMTPEMSRRIQEAVKEGKRIADQTWLNIGGSGDGTRQLLRYYKLTGEGAQWEQQNQQEIEAQQELNEAFKKLGEQWRKEDAKIYEKWLEVRDNIGKSATENELTELQRQYDAYSRVVSDKVELEQWWSEQKRAIELKAANESIALNEELYQATADQRYAQAAIEAMQAILDAEEDKWAKILDSDDDAHTLRLKREREYADRIKGLIKDVAETAADAAAETAQATQAIYDSSSAGSSGASGSEASRAPAASSGGGTYDVVYGRVFVNDRSGAQAYERSLEQIQETRARVARDAAEAAARAAEEAAEEARRAYEEKQQMLSGARDELDSFVRERTRRTWGQEEYRTEFTRLSEEFGQSRYYETSIDLLDRMLDVLASLDAIEQDTLEEQKRLGESLRGQSESISDWLIDLAQGSLAPVQSSAGWANRFEELKAQAQSGQGDVSEFLAYAQSYLEFEKNFGSSGSYAAAYESVRAAVESVGDWADLAARLSDLGLGDTIGDIDRLITAFEALGVPVRDLQAAADAAASAATSLNPSLAGESGLSAAVGVLKDAAGTAAGQEGLQKIIDQLHGALPQSAVDSMKNAGLLAQVLSDPTGTDNMTLLVSNMTTNVQAQLTTVAGFFDTLATQMGLTMNAGSAQTAIAALTPPPVVVAAAKTLVSTIETSPYIAPHEDITYNNAGTMIRTWDPGSPAHGKIVWSDGTVTAYGKGGLASGASIAGEIGPEWVVPTYEPQRSAFLRDVGADPEAIGRAVARQVSGALGAAGGDIHVHVHIDGREIGYVCAKQAAVNEDFIRAIKKAVH